MLSVAVRTASMAPGGGPSALSGAEKSRSVWLPSFSRFRMADWLPPCWIGRVARRSSMRVLSVMNEDEGETPTTRAGHNLGSRPFHLSRVVLRPASRMPMHSKLPSRNRPEDHGGRESDGSKDGGRGPVVGWSRRFHKPGQSCRRSCSRAWTAHRELDIIFA